MYIIYMFKCARCNKGFEYPYLLKRHLTRKYTCKEKNAIVPVNNAKDPANNAFLPANNAFCCKYCGKEIKRKDNLKKHEKKCKERDSHVRALEISLEIPIPKYNAMQCRFCNKEFKHHGDCARHTIYCKEKEKYIEKLKKRIKEKVQNVQNITNNNYINQNIVVINAFGKETTHHISDTLFKRILRLNRDCPSAIEKLAMNIHFNEKMPENHNVKYKNIKSKYGEVYNGKEFEVRPMKVITNTMVGNIAKMCSERYFQCYGENEDIDEKLDKIEHLIDGMFPPQSERERQEQREFDDIISRVRDVCYRYTRCVEEREQMEIY